MEILEKSMMLTSAISLLNVLSVVFGLLFMHYSAKHRNQQLSVGWYVCGILFGLWTVLVFLFKRKDFPGDKVKVCEQCGVRFPANFQVCTNCVIELPENNTEAKNKQKKLSRIFGIALIVVYILSFVCIGFYAGSIVDSVLNAEEQYRIDIDGVFYDKKGNSYENENDVPLYGEDGKVYTLVIETSEIDPLSEEYFYVSEDGEKYFELDCYITEEGWFYCDKAGLLELYSPDTSTMTEEELDKYYEDYLDTYDDEYRYYNYPYVDADGNIYFDAYEASWNEKGELITAETDITLK